jgi:hypothetical protein
MPSSAKPGVAAPADPLEPVYAAALAGDMVTGMVLLDALPATMLSPEQRKAADCIRARFGASPPEVPADLPPVTADILHAYRNYWRDVMLRKATPADGESALLVELCRILGARGSTKADLDAASDAAKAAIEAEGLFALTGVTLPYFELMVWRRNMRTTYRVPLPEREVEVTVVFLDDFVSLGWAGFATCERSHTGGWATATELYAVRSAYDIDSENFRVSYLAHEAQHFADYPRFPRLAQPELEYRAKLTELAQAATTTHDLVTRFAARSDPDRAIPHQCANFWVTNHLTQALLGHEVDLSTSIGWQALPPGRINAAARELLVASTRSLESRGAPTVERWLGE